MLFSSGGAGGAAPPFSGGAVALLCPSQAPGSGLQVPRCVVYFEQQQANTNDCLLCVVCLLLCFRVALDVFDVVCLLLCLLLCLLCFLVGSQRDS